MLKALLYVNKTLTIAVSNATIDSIIDGILYAVRKYHYI